MNIPSNFAYATNEPVETERTFPVVNGILTARADGSVTMRLSGRSINFSAEAAKALGGELCHAGNAALKLHREAAEAAKRITAADIKAGAVFYYTDSITRKDEQRTVVGHAGRFVFIDNKYNVMLPGSFGGGVGAAEAARLATANGYRKAR